MNTVLFIFSLVVAALALAFMFIVLDISNQNFLTRELNGKKRKSSGVKYIRLPQKRQAELQADLKEVNQEISPEEFVYKKVLKSLIVFIIMAVVTVVFVKDPLMWVLVLVVTGYTYIQPNRSLKRVKRLKAAQKKLEFPRYIKSLTTLMRSQTAFEALKKSVEYAPANIRPLVVMLINEMTLYPKNIEPFMNFSDRLGIVESKQYMLLLYQAMELSEENSREYIEKLSRMNEQMEAEAVNLLVDSEPSSMSKYVFAMLTAMILLPMSIALLTMFNMFSDM
ncbi:hypothetical protein [Priestia koreensis]|uniref:hypothetical protein n=1 Tax=Priestia koreensis TaxID=284581 RepID=UPI003016F477